MTRNPRTLYKKELEDIFMINWLMDEIPGRSKFFQSVYMETTFFFWMYFAGSTSNPNSSNPNHWESTILVSIGRQ